MKARQGDRVRLTHRATGTVIEGKVTSSTPSTNDRHWVTVEPIGMVQVEALVRGGEPPWACEIIERGLDEAAVERAAMDHAALRGYSEAAWLEFTKEQREWHLWSAEKVIRAYLNNLPGGNS